MLYIGNTISRSAKIAKSVIMGVGNKIGDNVRIGENVRIGNGNTIYSDTHIFPNVTIGDNNVMLEDCRIGEHPINMNYITEKRYGGLEMGSNNSLHTSVTLSSGYDEKTIVGDNNRISQNVNLGHDSHIGSNVHLYPNVLISGHARIHSNSGLGLASGVHQHCVAGAYSFLGMMSANTRNLFPFFIHVGNNIIRMNEKRIPPNYLKYEQDLRTIHNLCSREIPDNIELLLDSFPKDMVDHMKHYFDDVRKSLR